MDFFFAIICWYRKQHYINSSARVDREFQFFIPSLRDRPLNFNFFRKKKPAAAATSQWCRWVEVVRAGVHCVGVDIKRKQQECWALLTFCTIPHHSYSTHIPRIAFATSIYTLRGNSTTLWRSGSANEKTSYSASQWRAAVNFPPLFLCHVSLRFGSLTNSIYFFSSLRFVSVCCWLRLTFIRHHEVILLWNIVKCSLFFDLVVPFDSSR